MDTTLMNTTFETAAIFSMLKMDLCFIEGQ